MARPFFTNSSCNLVNDHLCPPFLCKLYQWRGQILSKHAREAKSSLSRDNQDLQRNAAGPEIGVLERGYSSAPVSPWFATPVRQGIFEKTSLYENLTRCTAFSNFSTVPSCME
jgi:hypothetical protein